MFKCKNNISAFIVLATTIFYSNEISARSNLSIAFQIPLEHHLAENILFFKQVLEQNSNNSISVNINDYGTYLKEIREIKEIKEIKEVGSDQKYFMAKDMLEAIQNRKVEIGMLPLTRIVKLVPLADIFNQPFLIDSEKKLADLLKKNSLVRQSIENSLKELGVVTLWWQTYGNVVFVSKGMSVNTPDNMKNKKVRVFGETLGNLVLAAGGAPLAIPNSLQYFAYKHKKVDIGMTTIADIRAKKIWEVMDTISLANSASMQFIIIANDRWWNSLRPDRRRLISAAASTAETKSVERLNQIEAESYREAIQNGMSLIVLSNDDKDYWREKSGPIYKKFLEKTGSEGRLGFDSIYYY